MVDNRSWVIFGRCDNIHEELFRQSRIMQARSNSSSSNSLKGLSIMTLVGARKVSLIWGIDIPRVAYFLFFPLEAWKSSSWMGSYLKPNLPLLSESSIRAEDSHVLWLRGLGLTCTQTWEFSLQPTKLLQANRTQALKCCESWKLVQSYGRTLLERH